MRVIYILFLRQIKRYWRSKSRIIGSLIQPLLFLLAFSFGFGPVFQKAGGVNYIEFLTPGIIGMSILFTAIFSGIDLIWDKQFGFIKETFVAPVSRWKIILGRILGGATTSAFQGFLVFLISLLFGFRPMSWIYLSLALFFMFLISFVFSALGTLIASILNDTQGFQLIMSFLVMPTFLFSGAIFPLNNLPEFLQIITKFNPLSYGIDGLRWALILNSHFNGFIDLFVLLFASLIFVSTASFIFSKMEIK
ncbi:MAG: ABC transporter permease [Minisyncoccia bacterium]